MSIKYEPSEILKRLAPETKIEKLLKPGLSLKRTALAFTSKYEVLDRDAIARVALKTIKGYKARVKADPDVKADIVDDPRQLIQRVQNEVVFQVANEIKDTYAGEFYVWLPSDAEEPDPEHQLKYGETFQIGAGEMPGDRIGCRCGMEILVKETKLAL